jgi:conjugal transfer mating pair stabilization protein TraN
MRTLLIFFITLLFSCGALAAKQCGVTSRACTSGPATVKIDGMEVTRPCWENTVQYACIEEGVSDTCAPSVAKGCKMSSTVCAQGVTINGVFQCITQQREYTCKVAEATSNTVANCGSQQYCIEGNCFDTGAAPDPDFAKAVTGMEIAREAGVYVDEASFQVFKGQDNRCSKSVLKNCCKGASAPSNGLTNLAIAGGSAYAFDVLAGGGMKSSLMIAGVDPTTIALAIAVMVVQQMMTCDTDEVLVAVKRDHRLCHYVGDYCSKKISVVFGKICVQHKETYCCFNSKISKIINEAARTQVPGMGWGSPENPSCQGISIAQFQAMDLSTVDFSEFYADIVPKGPDENEVRNRAASKVNSYFGH